MIKQFLLLACLIGLAGCAVERAQIAQDAQNKMIGLRKEQVLACMGVPVSKATEGATEVWAYNSGGGNAEAAAFRGVAFAETHYCIINVVMSGGVVSKINYSGPSGGALTGGEQCAFAVRNCIQ